MTIFGVGIVLLLANMLEGITGFGCTVIALPFITMLIGLKTAVPFLCIFSLFLSGYVVCRSWKHLQWKEFLYIVISVAIGMPVGMLMYDRMSPAKLCIVLACFMIGVGIHGIISAVKQRKQDTAAVVAPKKNWLMQLILFCGGIIHGAFNTGGPFVVIYATKAIPDKSVFRVTLCLLWFSLNTIKIISWLVKGDALTSELCPIVLAALPFAIAGMLLGDYLHHKVNYFVFRLCLYGMLAIAGCIMMINNILKIMNS